MPRFLKEYAYWIAAGVVILVVWGLYLFLVVPHKRSAREIVSRIDSAKGQLDALLRKTEIPNEKWTQGLQEPILRARGHESQVNRFMEGRKRNILHIWLNQPAKWGEKYLDGTSDQMQRIEYRELYPDAVLRVYNVLVLPLLAPAEQTRASRSGGGNMGSYIKMASWGEKIPTNKEIVDANTHLNITAAFCDMLLRAKEDVPDLYLFLKTLQVVYMDSSRVLAARTGMAGGMAGGMPGGGAPGGGMLGGPPGGYDMGEGGPPGESRGMPGVMPGGTLGRPPGEVGLGRMPGEVSAQDRMGTVMAQRRSGEEGPGRLPVSDPQTGKYMFGFSFDTVMDWRNIDVLVGKIVEMTGLDPRVDFVDWEKSKTPVEDVEAPLVDVRMEGRLFVDWPEGVAVKKPEGR